MAQGLATLTWEDAAKDHERLVASVVRDLGILGEAAKDARQEGLIALRKVASRYESTRNSAFSTFCRKVVVRAIIKHRKAGHQIRVPASTMDKVKNRKKRGGDVSEWGTAQDVQRAIDLKAVPLPDVSSLSECQEVAVDTTEEVEFLRRTLLKIPARSRQVIIRHCGLFGNRPESLGDIARDMEVPLSDVQSLLASATGELVLIANRKEM